MTEQFRGVAYMVVENTDLSEAAMPPLYIRFTQCRRTIHWRGKRFNVGAARVAGIEMGATVEGDLVDGEFVPRQRVEGVSPLPKPVVYFRGEKFIPPGT